VSEAVGRDERRLPVDDLGERHVGDDAEQGQQEDEDQEDPREGTEQVGLEVLRLSGHRDVSFRVFVGLGRSGDRS
jgi:hypothetical protein